jgi:hypothetical protein
MCYAVKLAVLLGSALNWTHCTISTINFILKLMNFDRSFGYLTTLNE